MSETTTTDQATTSCNSNGVSVKKFFFSFCYSKRIWHFFADYFAAFCYFVLCFTNSLNTQKLMLQHAMDFIDSSLSPTNHFVDRELSRNIKNVRIDWFLRYSEPGAHTTRTRAILQHFAYIFALKQKKNVKKIIPRHETQHRTVELQRISLNDHV